MAWHSIGIIALANEWQFTSEVTGSYFRLKHKLQGNSFYSLSAEICQADFTDSGVDIYQPKLIYYRGESEIIVLPVPNIWERRRVGVRKLNKEKSLLVWLVEIEVSDIMPIWNPSGPATPVTSSTANAVSVPVSTTSVSLLAANSSRIEAIIYNTSSRATLYLGYGAAATVGGSVPIAPGGYFELPADFTGAVNGIWNTTDTSGAAKVVEFVV